MVRVRDKFVPRLVKVPSRYKSPLHSGSRLSHQLLSYDDPFNSGLQEQVVPPRRRVDHYENKSAWPQRGQLPVEPKWLSWAVGQSLRVPQRRSLWLSIGRSVWAPLRACPAEMTAHGVLWWWWWIQRHPTNDSSGKSNDK